MLTSFGYGSLVRTVITLCGLNPSRTFSKSQKLRSRRPAATISTNESPKSATARARLADCHLARPRAGAREHQIRHVHAADEQDQSHGAQQQKQRLANVANDGLFQWHQPHGPRALRRVIGWKLVP